MVDVLPSQICVGDSSSNLYDLVLQHLWPISQNLRLKLILLKMPSVKKCSILI